MVMVVAPDRVDAVRGILQSAGETVAAIGTIRPRAGDEPGCKVLNTGKW
jgi:phosphoribosylaminoimidazole (AIR) synthetase